MEKNQRDEKKINETNEIRKAKCTLNTFGSMNPTFSGTFYPTCMKMVFMDLKRNF